MVYSTEVKGILFCPQTQTSLARNSLVMDHQTYGPVPWNSSYDETLLENSYQHWSNFKRRVWKTSSRYSRRTARFNAFMLRQSISFWMPCALNVIFTDITYRSWNHRGRSGKTSIIRCENSGQHGIDPVLVWNKALSLFTVVRDS